MRPVSPVIPGDTGQAEIIIAETQDEYGNLPALISPEGVITTRWELTEEEKAFVAKHGWIYLEQHTFHNPVQPISLWAGSPSAYATLDEPTTAVGGLASPTPEKCSQRPANSENQVLTGNQCPKCKAGETYFTPQDDFTNEWCNNVECDWWREIPVKGKATDQQSTFNGPHLW